MSLGLRVQCDPNRISVRPINLYLQDFYSITSASDKLAQINSDLPGTTITVKPGDSVYKLSRLIFSHDEMAVANLAGAIVLANPALFPDGHGRPLQVGERLTIPDLRTVERIVARSVQPGKSAALQPAPTSSVPRQRSPVDSTPSVTTGPDTEPASSAMPTRKRIAAGKLRLQLATGLDLGRAGGVAKQKRPPLRQQAAAKTAGSADVATLSKMSALASRVDRIRQIQDGINTRLARLEAASRSLRIAFTQTPAPRRPDPAAARRPAVTRAEQPPKPEAAPTTPVTKRATPPAKPAVAPRAAAVESRPAAPPAWRSYAVFAVAFVLAIVLVLLGRNYVKRRSLVKQRTRIDAMLAEARTAATPLLGAEPAFETGDAAEQRSGPPPAEPEVFEAAEQPASAKIEPEIFDPSKTQPFSPADFTEPTATPSVDSPAREEPPARLRSQMDDAMDATRSMFTDVDRFITLGRIQNAISLLEFQVKREPTDRDSWIKLMAVYRGEGMGDDFDRTYAAFRDQFGDNIG